MSLSLVRETRLAVAAAHEVAEVLSLVGGAESTVVPHTLASPVHAVVGVTGRPAGPLVLGFVVGAEVAQVLGPTLDEDTATTVEGVPRLATARPATQYLMAPRVPSMVSGATLSLGAMSPESDAEGARDVATGDPTTLTPRRLALRNVGIASHVLASAISRVGEGGGMVASLWTARGSTG